MAYYVNGKEEGQYTVYHPNGAVYYTGKYHEGKRVGTWSFYDENEKLVQTQEY
jgi:antitoxin component YwqK of YwqJK toxin-antitoxin module